MQQHPSDAYIRMKTKIYGHDPSKKVRNYQLEVNDAAVDLALNDPYLLLCRQESLELSCNKVKEGGIHLELITALDYS